MLLSKKLAVGIALGAFMVAGIAASRPPADPIYKNLKVLPKKISHDDLDKVMHHFNDALGVKCNFCHAPQAENERRLDFASDAKPEKEIARDMMRMTTKINKKYFKSAKDDKGEVAQTVTCTTCHHGTAHPESK